LLHAANIGGSGVTLDVGSRTAVQALVGSGNGMPSSPGAFKPDGKKVDVAGMSIGLSTVKWNPTVTAKKDFAVWGNGQPDTTVHAGLGLGIDGGLIGAYYGSGGSGAPPVNSYVTAGVVTRPANWLTVSADGYAPITHATNDFASKPLVRVAVSTPYATVATTQGVSQAGYEASTGVTFGKVQIGAFASVTEDRLSGQTDKRVGGQVNVLSW
jgi:hypothetical protein